VEMHSVWREMAQIVLFILYCDYFVSAEQVVQMFGREQAPPGVEPFMLAYPWVSATSDSVAYWALFWMSLAGVAVIVIPIPIIFIVIIRHLRDPQFREMRRQKFLFGFLYVNYHSEDYWFELVWMSRRLILFILLAFVPRGSIDNPSLAFPAAITALFLIYIALQHEVQPFVRPLENLADILCMCVVVFTFVVTWRPNTSPVPVWLSIALLALHFVALAFIYSGFHWLALMQRWRRSCHKPRIEGDDELPGDPLQATIANVAALAAETI